MNARHADRISRKLWPAVSKALRGQPPEIQGAVLADLTAIWLAGHVIVGDEAESAKMREEMLRLHVDAIRSLIELYSSKGSA